MKPAGQRPLIVLAICAAVTGLLLFLWLRGFVPLRQMEFSAQDWQARLGRKTPVDDRLVLIGIDKPVYLSDFSDDELQREPVLHDLQNNFPWSRAVWARLLQKLSVAGAKVIVFDLVFSPPGNGDDGFRAALEKYKSRVVIGYNISVENLARGDSRELQLPNESLLPAQTNSPVEDDRLGFVNIWPDFDDTLRAANFRLTGAQAGDILPAETILESLDARALEKFGRANSIPAGFGPHLFRYTAVPGHAFRPNPVGDVLSPKLWDANFGGGKFFKDKLVLIGPTAEIFQDVHNTPFNNPKAMAGPEIHLQILNAALHGEFLSELSPFAAAAFIALAGIIAALVCLFLRAPLPRVFAFLLLGAGFLLATKICFDHANLILPVVPPLIVLGGIGLAVLIYDFVVERLERMKLRHTMGLYFSPRVLEAVLADPGSMQPRRAEVVLLLTDLRNSTPLAETLGPQKMFELLNRVFEAQTNAIMGEEGNLEHFLGDQFLSYWGAPQKQADAPERAMRAAQKLISAMEKLRATLSPEVQKLFGYGVALHSGNVLVGNKGSALRLDYGLVGDTVNEAARVEALTKFYGAKFLVTREVFARLAPQATRRLVDRVIVKGKSEPVELYECENPCTPPNYAEICARYKTACDEYHFGKFAGAQKLFDALAREFSDGPSKAMSTRCGELILHPPANWNGIWKMDAK